MLGALSVAHAQGVQNHFQSAYPNFEGGEAAPLAISNDGSTLFALNQADHRLELYTANANGLLLDYAGDVFTGLEPSAIALDPNDNTTVFVSPYAKPQGACGAHEHADVLDAGRLVVRRRVRPEPHGGGGGGYRLLPRHAESRL